MGSIFLEGVKHDGASSHRRVKTQKLKISHRSLLYLDQRQRSGSQEPLAVQVWSGCLPPEHICLASAHNVVEEVPQHLQIASTNRQPHVSDRHRKTCWGSFE